MNFDTYPCPFCGYKIDLIIPETEEEIPWENEKICDRCGNVVKMPFIVPYKAKESKKLRRFRRFNQLINCIIEQGSDPCLIETEEDATNWLDTIENAERVWEITDPEEYQVAKKKLNLENNTTRKIYGFVNGNAGTYCLSEDWDYNHPSIKTPITMKFFMP